MNGNDILRSMNGIDERYIASARRDIAAKRKGFGRRSVSAAVGIAAAVALMTVSAGAYAFTQFFNRDSVERYLENADGLEASGNVENQVMENEHIRITLDTVLSDGYNAMAVITIEAFDDYGKNFVENTPYIMLRNTETGETVRPSGVGGYEDRTGQLLENKISFFRYIDLCKGNIALDHDYEMIFYSDGLFTNEDRENAAGKDRPLDENMIPVDNPLGYDFTARVNFTKNVDTVKLTGSNGKEIELSQFEIVTESGLWDNSLPDKIVLIGKDGTEETVGEKCYGMSNYEVSTVFFGRFIELDDYAGIRIDGIEYMRTE